MSRETQDTKNYVSILASDGTFRLSVPEGTPGEVKREWEVDGKKGTKNEIVYKSLTGKISGVSFVTADFGKLLQVTLLDEEGELTISTSASNNFATDLMKKLPSLDLSQEYKFKPYSFEDDKGKTLKGVSITLGEEKMKNFFYDGTENTNGFPSPKDGGKGFTKNKWKAYFGEVEDFLIEYTEKNFQNIEKPVANEVNPEDVPF